MQTYTAAQLRAMPTIRSGPVNDLKLDTGRVQVWVRRDEGKPAITVLMCTYGTRERIGTFSECLSVPCQRLLER